MSYLKLCFFSARQVQNANSKDGQVPTVSSFTSLNPTPSTSATVQPSSVSATDAETLAGMFPFFNCDNAEGKIIFNNK